MSIFNKHNSPTKIIFALMFALAAVDVMRGRFPAQPISFLLGCSLAPLAWARFYKIKSTVWSRLGLLLSGVILFVASVAIGVLLKPFGEQVGHYYHDAWLGFFLGLCSRAVIIKSSNSPNSSKRAS